MLFSSFIITSGLSLYNLTICSRQVRYPGKFGYKSMHKSYLQIKKRAHSSNIVPITLLTMRMKVGRTTQDIKSFISRATNVANCWPNLRGP